MDVHRERLDVLVVEDDIGLLNALLKLFRKERLEAEGVQSAEDALKLIGNRRPKILIVDIVLPGMDGIELLKRVKRTYPEIEVIVMTGYGTVKTAVESMKLGAFDYIQKPFDRVELLSIVKKAFKLGELERKVKELESILKGHPLIGKSKKFLEVVERAKAVANTDIPVLVVGESGTGKEVLSRYIHDLSPRRGGPFVPVNCSAIPKDLFESELFGHKKGAFTGALYSSPGLFRAADGGTLFLDEIAEMPLELQPKLLRAIETKTIRPIGESREIPIDVRIIASTNRDIRREVREGRFRRDLFYRFVVVINLPPLRERKEDIPLLVTHFIEKFNKIYGRHVEGVEREALEALMNYSWPGNVRELENIIEGIFAFGVGSRITLEDLPPYIRKNESVTVTNSLKDVERETIIKILEEVRWNKKKAAEILGISRSTLYRKLKKYGID